MNWNLWVLIGTFTSQIRLSVEDPIRICVGKKSFEYNLNSCPGGIQLRDANRWLSKTREKACICGQGSVLQFDGKDPNPEPNIYSIGFPEYLKPFQGSFSAYNLETDCEQLLGNQPSALLLDMKYFEDPDNFPHRPLELLVAPSEHDRVAGSYRIGIYNGRYSKQEVQTNEQLRTVMFNTKDPVIITPNPLNKTKRFCAHTTKPQLIVAKYLTSNWFQQDQVTAPNCGVKAYPSYDRPRGTCRSQCPNDTGSDDMMTSSENTGLQQYQKIFELMTEVSLRLKYTKKEISFSENQHHVALLQKSCRVFFRAFPNVIKWETLMHAVSIFGISFEGLIPTKIDSDAFNHIRIALSRCALELSRQHEDNDKLFKTVCSKKGGTTESQGYNNLIELLWQIVQFTQAKCLPSIDHYPNVHHFYASAMIELFSSPTVQLLWHQTKENGDVLNKAMMHVLPELPSHTLGTVQEVLKQMDYQIYFAILQRPKIRNMEQRDMRCAGHGKIIWGGRACCYMEEEDKKYRFYNRVSFAKL